MGQKRVTIMAVKEPGKDDNIQAAATTTKMDDVKEKEAHDKLCQMVYDKTKGNPFFILQYLTTLQRRKWLTYTKTGVTCTNANNGKWECHLNQWASGRTSR